MPALSNNYNCTVVADSKTDNKREAGHIYNYNLRLYNDRGGDDHYDDVGDDDDDDRDRGDLFLPAPT